MIAYLQVTRGDVVTSDERLLERDDFVETNVSVERRLRVGEDDDRAVGTVTTARSKCCQNLSRRNNKKCAYANWPWEVSRGEKAIASWKVMRRASCASAAHSPPLNMFACRSSRIANREQHAALVAVFLPSGQATRRVSAAAR